MNMSSLMVHSQQVEDSKAERNSKHAKRARSFDGGSLKGSLDIQHNPRFKKLVSNQGSSKLPKSRDDRVSNCKT